MVNDGRNMILVIVSGFHSRRKRPSQLLLREKFLARLLEKDDFWLTKFSEATVLLMSPSLWFHLSEASILSLFLFS